MKLSHLGLASGLLFSTSVVEAGGLDLNVSSETAQVGYFSDISRISTGGTDLGFVGFFDENGSVLGSVNFKVTSSNIAGSRAFQLSFGTRVYALTVPEDDQGRDIDASAAGIMLGAGLRYVIPSATPMAITFDAYGSPPITTFGDADNVSELTLRYEIEIFPKATGYVGYRRLTVSFDDDANVPVRNVDLDQNFHLGIRFQF